MRRKFLTTLFFLLLINYIWRTPTVHAGILKSALPDSTRATLLELENNFGELKSEALRVLGSFPNQLADIQKRLSELQGMAELSSSDLSKTYELSEVQIQNRMTLISDLMTAYNNHELLLKRLQVEQERLANMVSEDSVVDGSNPLSQLPPYTLTLYDSYRQSYEKNEKALGTELFFMKNDLNSLSLALSDLQKAKQNQQEFLSSNDLNNSMSRWNIQMAELKVELAKVRLFNSVQSATEEQLRKEERIQALELQERQMNWIAQHTAFSENDLKKIIDDIQKNIDTLRQNLPGVKAKLNEASASYDKVRSMTSDDMADTSLLTPESTFYNERLTNVDYWEYTLGLMQDELEWLSQSQQIWTLRYNLFHGRLKGDEIWKNRNLAQNRIVELKATFDNMQILQADYYARLSEIKAQIEGATGKNKQNLIALSQTLQNILSNVFNRYIYLISQQIFLEQSFLEEAGAKIDALRLAEQVGNFSKETFLGFMNTTLWSGEGYSVTVSKLIAAVIIFVSSFFISNRGSRWLQRKVLKRFSADITAARAAQRVLFYILWFSFILISLQLVRIPLTAFAFLGGTMLVAIGFGAQNLFSNLISGFIIMFSRPFKESDIVEVDGVSGTVAEIGTRSTRIRTWDNIDVMLPNRYMLENKVTNWTGSDKKIRDKLVLGVAYDSDSRVVEDLLLKVAKEHTKILKDPPPVVFFGDLGESSLVFTLYFWVDLGQASSAKVASDLRHYIISLFREEGIKLPFPQLDVHLPDAPVQAKQ